MTVTMQHPIVPGVTVEVTDPDAWRAQGWLDVVGPSSLPYPQKPRARRARDADAAPTGE